jgi:hypothetical protein
MPNVHDLAPGANMRSVHRRVRVADSTYPMDTLMRLMFLKFRYRLGYESLCAEVSDSISWRRVSLTSRMPGRSPRGGSASPSSSAARPRSPTTTTGLCGQDVHLSVAGPVDEFVQDAVAASAGVAGQHYLGDLVLVCELREGIGRAALQRGEPAAELRCQRGVPGQHLVQVSGCRYGRDDCH